MKIEIKLNKEDASLIRDAFVVSQEDEYYARLEVQADKLIWVTSGGSEYFLNEKEGTLTYLGSRLGFQHGARWGGVTPRWNKEGTKKLPLPNLTIYFNTPLEGVINAELLSCESSTPEWVIGRNNPFHDVLDLINQIEERESEEKEEELGEMIERSFA